MDDYPNCKEATFYEWYDYIDVAALVKIVAVKKSGALVKAEVINLFKGKVSQKFYFDVSLSWMPEQWFIKNKINLVFLKRLKNQSLNSFSYNAKIEIDEDRGEAYCFDCAKDYWNKNLIKNYNEKESSCN